MNKSKFGEQLRARRTALELRQEDLAAVSDVGLTTIKKIEHPTIQHLPTMAVADRLLTALGGQLVTDFEPCSVPLLKMSTVAELQRLADKHDKAISEELEAAIITWFSIHNDLD